MDRISTGDAASDQILGGGFPANTINILMGEPGTGKTIFVEQILFANARDERPALYLTTLSEPMAKVVRFVQEFEFYDETKLGTSIVYEDIGAELATNGISALISRLKEAIRTISPSLIVIDSFKAVHDLSESTTEMRKLVHELTGMLSAYETTAFLIGEYHREDIRHHPEFAVADGVVELSRRQLGTRDDRFFRVLKLRGSHFLEGSHAFRITSGGLDIHPRLVTPRTPVDYQSTPERVSTGVPALDDLMEGGLPRGSSTLLAGPSGSGKTTLALQFLLDGARRDEPSLCINFQENPTQLARTVHRLAGDPEIAEALDLLYYSPVELAIDSVIRELFRRIESRGVKRVVLDAIGDLSTAQSEPHRLHEYLYALVQHLAVNGVTSILTFESPEESISGGQLSAGPISYMADNILVLGMRGEETMRRTIRVLKARGSGHDPNVHDVAIDPHGIRLA